MRVWILQTGEPMPTDADGSRPMRAMNLAAALIEAGHSVVIWTADFNHFTLKHRFGRDTRVRVNDQLEVRLVHSPGYTSNLGVQRLVDHGKLASHLHRLLRAEHEIPDVGFIGFPPIEVASVMNNWLRARDVPTVVDVKDAWPDVLERAVPDVLRGLGKSALYPYRRLACECLATASGLSSTTEDFLWWSLNMAGRERVDADLVLPLTSPLATITIPDPAATEWLDQLGVLDDGSLRVSFVGALHSSYDFAPVARAARARPEVQFVLCGDGSKAREVARLMEGLPNVVMPGWVSAEQADALARRASIALIPIAGHDDYLLNVTNKFYDSIAKGLPVAVGLEGALGRIVRANAVGWVYGGSDRLSLEAALDGARQDPETLSQFGVNARELYEREFEFHTVYSGAVRHLEQLASGQLMGAEQSHRRVEKERYDERSRRELEWAQSVDLPNAVDDQDEILQPPYRAYEQRLRAAINREDLVLELGSGSGRHSVAVVECSDHVVALDISVTSLAVARLRTRGAAAVVGGDIAALPFANETFDVVVCAGSLSYANPVALDNEIVRVLRCGGVIVLVDSLDHNPIYRINRRQHLRRGQRTEATMHRIATVPRLERLWDRFETHEIEYFGTFDFAYPVLKKVVGAKHATQVCQYIDGKFGHNKYGFKFVLVAQGPRDL